MRPNGPVDHSDAETLTTISIRISTFTAAMETS